MRRITEDTDTIVIDVDRRFCPYEKEENAKETMTLSEFRREINLLEYDDDCPVYLRNGKDELCPIEVYTLDVILKEDTEDER